VPGSIEPLYDPQLLPDSAKTNRTYPHRRFATNLARLDHRVENSSSALTALCRETCFGTGCERGMANAHCIVFEERMSPVRDLSWAGQEQEPFSAVRDKGAPCINGWDYEPPHGGVEFAIPQIENPPSPTNGSRTGRATSYRRSQVS
jgi:hypothetical protein